MDRHFVVAAQTDRGITKKLNQDSLTVKVARTTAGEVAFAVLCDGIGGLSFGEVASEHVVRSFERWFGQELPVWLQAGGDVQRLFQRWNQVIHQCNQELVSYEQKIKGYVGTTLTTVLLVKNHYYVAHVGDCRLYEMESGIRQITKDHTVQEEQNVLLQCIGVNEIVNPDFLQGEIQDGMSLLICSDGFRHQISQQEILQYCHRNLDTLTLEKQSRQEMNEAMNQQLCYLIELNKNRNEKDDISAILMKVV